MGTITTTTQANPFEYPNQAFMTVDPRLNTTTGTYDLWVVVQNSAGNFEMWRSQDGGTTWALRSTLTRANVQEYGQIQMTVDGWIHWIYRTNESSQDRIYYRRHAAWDTAWQAEKLVASPSNGGVAGAYHTGIDLALDRQGSTETTYVVIAAGTQVGSNQGVTLYALTAKPTNIITVNNGLIAGTRQWLTAGTGRVPVEADKEHNGDGLTRKSSSPNVWVAWGRNSISMVKLTWTGSGWSAPSAPIIAAAYTFAALDMLAARWDGSRYLIAYPNQDGLDTVTLVERNQANTGWTTRSSPSHPTGLPKYVGVNYNTTTGDTRLYAVGTSTNVLYYVDYVRATGLWTSWAQVQATAVLNGINWGSRPATSDPGKYDVYIADAGVSPFTLRSVRQSVAYPPNTPTWESTSTPFASGGAASVSAALLLDWAFTDPDPSDTQSAWALSRQIGTGALAYWRASDSTWQAAEVKNIGSTTQLSLASGWGTGTDATHTYKVKVWDSADTASQYSAGLAVTASTPANPTITAPTAGATVTADSVTVTWTVSDQSKYRVTLTTGGNQVYDSGIVTSTATSLLIPYTLADATSYTIGLTTYNSKGLQSATQTVTFSVAYVQPAVPTTLASPIPLKGIIQVAITNPTPTGGQPALASQDLYRRVVGSGEPTGTPIGATLASGAVVDDWSAVSGVAYEYRSIAKGTNGTTSFGAWTP